MAEAAVESSKLVANSVTKRTVNPKLLKKNNSATFNHWLFKCLSGLQKELRTLMISSSPGISAFPDGDNMFQWIGTIEGAKGTVYEGLSYKLSLTFPAQYPIEAVKVKFETPCYHPNVDNHGNICLDILKEKWSALYDVRTVLLSIQSLLAEPNIDSPLNTHAADLWNNQVAYKKVLLDKYNKEVRKISGPTDKSQKLS